MRIVITGALGHIGSALIRNIGSSVGVSETILVDNLATQRFPSLFDLGDHGNFTFIDQDVCSPTMAEVITGADALVHLAAITNAEASVEKQSEVEHTNVLGLQNIANICAREGCKLIFPSTTSVYGSQDSVVDEQCALDDLRPQSPYAQSKIDGENYLHELANDVGLEYCILRIGTIFGFSPGMRFHTAVNKFIWQANLNKPLTVWRTALDQRRPYCGLRDAVNGITHVINSNLFKGETYNLVTANHTVREIVDLINLHTGNIEISFVDSVIMNQLSYEVDNQKSLDAGFNYVDELSDAIQKTLARLNGIRTHG